MLPLPLSGWLQQRVSLKEEFQQSHLLLLLLNTTCVDRNSKCTEIASFNGAITTSSSLLCLPHLLWKGSFDRLFPLAKDQFAYRSVQIQPVDVTSCDLH